MGILDAADAKHIELCAETFQDYRDAQEDILALGRIVAQETDKATIYRRNPAFTTMEKARVTLRSFYSDLGLTPSARAKFGSGNDENDPFEDLMRRAAAN
jgi:P27 family predicted phage terminase small subunit